MKEEEAATKSKGGKGRAHGIMSGRALFQYNPDLFKDDENAGAAEDYEEALEAVEESKEEYKASEAPEKKEEPAVDDALFAAEATGADEDVDFDWL